MNYVGVDLHRKGNTVENEQLLPLSDARILVDITYVINAIPRNGGNLSRSAKELGIGHRSLYDLMERYGISCADGSLSIEITPLMRYMEMKALFLEDYLMRGL